MSMSQLLLRGMLVGMIAGLLAFAVAHLTGEPAVDKAIAFETMEAHSHDMPGMPPTDEPELVSRGVQSSIGLLTGTLVVGTAFGGLFGLVFALAYGRMARTDPRTLAALLGLAAFVAICLAPTLKYPANPPSIGQPETIGLRTTLYMSMVVLSIVATVAALSLRRVLLPRFGAWNAALASILTFAVLVGGACVFLPAVDEVPAGFPAQTLWAFRLSSLAIEATLWGVIGLLFGALTERAVARGAGVSAGNAVDVALR